MTAATASKEKPVEKTQATEMAEAFVTAQTKVAENAVIIDRESKSRAQRRKAIDEELRASGLDNEDTKPYIAYSTEVCPHTAPTVGDCDFPKFIYKRGKKGQPDQAVKKIVWLTDLEAERIRRYAAIKFMAVVQRDEEGNPIIDKRTEQPRTKPVPYSAFIRLIPTMLDKETGMVTDDPSEVIQKLMRENEALKGNKQSLESELAEFRGGKLSKSGVVDEHDIVLEEENKRLKESKPEANLREAEALARDPEAKVGKSSFRK